MAETATAALDSEAVEGPLSRVSRRPDTAPATDSALHLPSDANPLRVDAAGRPVEIWVESGVVVGVRKLSQTYVSGYVSQGSGRISSETVNTTEFAVLGSDGIERPHWFSGHTVFLRDGHRVSLIHGSFRASNWAYIVNHDTRKSFNMWSPAAYVYYLGLIHRIGWPWFVLAVAAVIGLGMALPGLQEAGGLLLWSALGSVLTVKIVQWWRARSLWSTALRPHFDRLEQQLLAASDDLSWPLRRIP